MKIFGLELKFNNHDIWHGGNFNPDSKANVNHTHTKSQIVDFPTKLSQFENDIGAGGGIKITVSPSTPSNPSPGDFWYEEV